MQFKVPQFMHVEDKLFGPFTFRQFAYLAGGAGLIYIIYKLLPIWIGIFFILPVGILTGLLVFYKINDKPFIFYLQAAISYFISSKLYLWKQRVVKNQNKNKETEESDQTQITSVIPMVSSDKLKDISWSLDIQSKNVGDK